MGASGSRPSPELLEDYSQLRRGGQRARMIWQLEGDLVDDLCAPVHTRLTQRLHDQWAELQTVSLALGSARLNQ